MGTVADIFRHPLKSHGVERLDAIQASQGQALPWDRMWAVAHEAAKLNGNDWSPCANFTRVSKAPQMQAITCSLDEATGTMTLRHPKRKDFTFQPDDERQLSGFLAWTKPLVPENRAQSARIVRIGTRGMTDTDYASVSLNNHASLRALSQHMGQDLAMGRFRGNFWVDGLAPFEEHEWIGKEIQIGKAVFEGVEPIERCMATTANPETGERDADTLATLNKQYGHQDFGLYMRVAKSGEIRTGDAVTLIK